MFVINKNLYRTKAYSLFHWVKYRKGINNLIKYPHPIIDEDINIERYFLDLNSFEEKSFKNDLSNLLLLMADCLIELRHYSAARQCLDESISFNDDNLCVCLLRRSQCHLYNKNSKNDDLYQALDDIKRAIRISKYKYDKSNEIFFKNLHFINITIENRKKREFHLIKGIFV